MGKSSARPTALAVGVGGFFVVVFLTIFPSSIVSLQLYRGDGSIETEILPQRTVQAKTTDQHSTVGASVHLGVCICTFSTIGLAIP